MKPQLSKSKSAERLSSPPGQESRGREFEKHPSPRSERRLTWLLFLLALGVSVLVAKRAKPPALPAELDLLLAVPQGPGLLVSADLRALSPAVLLELMRAGGGALLGLRQPCGFEPVLALRRLVFAVPFRSGTTPGGADFALVADTSLEPEPVLRCAELVIRKRGGQPVRSSLGRFRSVRDQKKPLGEVAIRDDGLFVLSGGQYFRDVVDAAGGAAVGDEASRLRTQLHLEIRRRLSPSLLVASWLPGESSPLPGVRALGLGLDVGPDVRLRGLVGCVSASVCRDAARLLEQLKTDLARAAGLSGLETLSVTPREVELEVRAHLSRAELVPLLSQLLAP